jgi:hypothetical protein
LTQHLVVEVRYEGQSGWVEEEARVSKKKERLRAELARLVAGLVESIFGAIREASLDELGVATGTGGTAQGSKIAPPPRTKTIAEKRRSATPLRSRARPRNETPSSPARSERGSADEIVPLAEETVISNPEALLAALVERKSPKSAPASSKSISKGLSEVSVAQESVGDPASSSTGDAAGAADAANAADATNKQPATEERPKSGPAPRSPALRADEVLQRTPQGGAVIRRRRGGPAAA